MAPTNHHPTFKSPGQGSGPPDEAGEENGDWERASTVQPEEEGQHNVKPADEQRLESEHVGSQLAEPKYEHDSEAEPETFDKIEITEEDCIRELGYSFPEWKKIDDSHNYLPRPTLHELQYQSLLKWSGRHIR